MSEIKTTHWCSCEGGKEGDYEDMCVIDDPNYTSADCVYTKTYCDHTKCPDYKIRTLEKSKPAVDEQKRRWAENIAANWLRFHDHEIDCCFCLAEPVPMLSKFIHKKGCIVTEALQYLEGLEVE